MAEIRGHTAEARVESDGGGGGVCLSQSCSILCNPMNYSLTGSSVHGILQARILEWVAILFSMGSSQLRDQTQVSCITGRLFSV